MSKPTQHEPEPVTTENNDNALQTLQSGPDLTLLFQRNRELLDRNPAWAFPQGESPNLYPSYLEHVPFLVTGDIKWGRKPASTITEYDEKGNPTGTRTIPEQDCVTLTVRQIQHTPDSEKPVVLAPKPAILTGAYLLNQIRSFQQSEAGNMLFGGYVWTIRRNPKHTAVGGQHPYMLGLYDAALDETVSPY